MKFQMARPVILTTFLFTLVLPATAAIIVDNGLTNQTGGGDLNLFQQADNFTLASARSIDLIRFWTLQESTADYAGSIEWSILRDSGGNLPGLVVASGSFNSTQTATGNSASGLSEFIQEGLVSINLGVGTYWLVLHNGPSSSQPATSFYWAFADDQTGNSLSKELALGNSGTWVSNGAELAFQLEGAGGGVTVPEPGSVLLVGAAMAMFMIRSKTRSAL